MNKRVLTTLVLMWGVFSFLFSFASPPVGAVLVDLTGEDVKEALRYGRDNKDTGYLEFFKDWRVDLGYGTGSARVITPFSKIAFEAKHAAPGDEPVDSEVIDEILEKSRGKLAFGVSVYGEARDFAQGARAVLVQKEKTIKPIESKPVMKAEPTDSWPNPPAYRAICYYYFDTKEVDPDGTATLVVSLPGQKDVEFKFDLSGAK